MRGASRHPTLDPIRSIDLATALGVGIENATRDDLLATIAPCTSPLRRYAYWAFLAAQGVRERTIHEAHPQAMSFLVHHDGQAVGAAALLPDSPLGLPIPESFQPIIARLRREGRQLVLLDPLIIPAELPARNADLVLRALLRLVLLTARRLDGHSDLLLHCAPQHARFFTQVLLCRIEAEQVSKTDAPTQFLLRLDLDLCPGEWRRLYGDNPCCPYSLYVRPSPQAARIVAWLRRYRQPPSFHELITTWIAPGNGTPAIDRASLACLCRLYPGLSERLSIRRYGGGKERSPL